MGEHKGGGGDLEEKERKERKKERERKKGKRKKVQLTVFSRLLLYCSAGRGVDMSRGSLLRLHRCMLGNRMLHHQLSSSVATMLERKEGAVQNRRRRGLQRLHMGHWYSRLVVVQEFKKE